MQRMWMRALIFAAVGAVSVMVVNDTEAGHRHHRRGCGSSGGYYGGYSYGGSYGGSYVSGGYTYGRGYAVRSGYTYGGGYSNSYGAWGPGVYTRGVAGMTYDANGRLISPRVIDRTARGSVRVDASTGLNGQVSPSNRTRAGADASIGAGTNAAGSNARAGANVRGGADVNRNDTSTPPETLPPPDTSSLPPPPPNP